MRLRAEFDRPETVRPDDYVWTRSPAGGVDRMMLDRVGDEVARATTIVRFAPGSRFDPHTHGGGEEFLVLEGVFSDETGDYPVGSYVRNPIGTTHRPHTDPGCTILVKLHQFSAADTDPVCIDTRNVPFQPIGATGVEVLPLHRFGSEDVRMLRLSPEADPLDLPMSGGGEIMVVDGAVHLDGETLPAGSWLRRPPETRVRMSAPTGALIWVKTGHLAG